METGLAFGRYTVRSVLGTGAMSIVYQGYDRALDRRVAIKTIRKDLLESDEADQIRERFRQEARIIAKLKHRNFVTVFELVEDWDPPFIAMELVSAKNLAQTIREGHPFTHAQTAKIGMDLLDALSYLHGQSLVHRDIKPANLFWAEGEPLKVADLGVAHTWTSTLTQLGSTIGTPAYMAPEQFQGERVDARIDLWAAGVILYELLTGTRCFKGDQDTVKQAVLTGDPFSFPLAQERIEGTAFGSVLRKALAKNPDERFQDAMAFSAALRAAYSQQCADSPGDLLPASFQEDALPQPLPAVSGHSALAEDDDATVLVSPARKTAPSSTSPLSLRGIKHKAWIFAAAGGIVSAAIYWSVSAWRPVNLIPAPGGLNKEISKVILTAQCSDLRFSLDNDLVKVVGFVPSSEVKADLQVRLSKLIGTERLSVFTEIRPWPFCDVLQTLKPYGKAQSQKSASMHIRVQDYTGQLMDGDAVNLEMRSPGFEGHIYVDYFQGDHNVVHLLPSTASGLGKIKQDTEFKVNAGNAGSPFGDEMIVMVASRSPLFAQHRPEYEPAEQYLSALKAELSKLSNTEIVSDYLLIKTVKRK